LFYALLNRFTFTWIVSHNVSDFVWIVSQYLESIHSWIESNLPESHHENFLTYIESIQFDLNRFILHPDILNWFKLCLNRINHHSLSDLYSCCLNWFTHLVNRFTMLFLAKFFHFTPYSIYTHFLTTPKILNHLHIFSLGLKNSLFIHSSGLNTFFLESLCTLSHMIC